MALGKANADHNWNLHKWITADAGGEEQKNMVYIATVIRKTGVLNQDHNDSKIGWA